ncbi:MAG: MazG family protein [Acidimicrobiales bacterium]
MRQPRVVVCGLGPATADLVTAATTAAIGRIDRRFLRTRRHPSADVVGDAEDLDDLYQSAATFDEVYDGIVARLVAAAQENGEVLYAVPGSPAVAESTVERLRADSRVDVEVLPALSFLDLAWDRLGLDPLDSGVRLVDAHRFDTEAAGERGPLLVAQCDSRQVLSDVKLAIATSDAGPGDRNTAGSAISPSTAAVGEPLAVTVLQRLGLPDEQVIQVPWTELDRSFEPDHLTSLYMPRLAAPIAGEVAAFAAVVRRLRRDCPWDRVQTHASLRRHLVEEAYEVLEAIDHLDPETGAGVDALEEELGDLLFQVVFHATLAAEEGHFDLADVARGISEKLIGRHPHVFGDVDAATADEVVTNWEQIKKAEKGRASVMDGIPVGLPALLYALKVQKRAAVEDVDWRDLVAEGNGAPAPDDLGYRLLSLVDEARRAGEDPESELRTAAEGIRDRFRVRPTE